MDNFHDIFYDKVKSLDIDTSSRITSFDHDICRDLSIIPITLNDKVNN